MSSRISFTKLCLWEFVGKKSLFRFSEKLKGKSRAVVSNTQVFEDPPDPSRDTVELGGPELGGPEADLHFRLNSPFGVRDLESVVIL